MLIVTANERCRRKAEVCKSAYARRSAPGFRPAGSGVMQLSIVCTAKHILFAHPCLLADRTYCSADGRDNTVLRSISSGPYCTACTAINSGTTVTDTNLPIIPATRKRYALSSCTTLCSSIWDAFLPQCSKTTKTALEVLVFRHSANMKSTCVNTRDGRFLPHARSAHCSTCACRQCGGHR